MPLALRSSSRLDHQNLLTLPSKLLTLIPRKSPRLSSSFRTRFTDRKWVEIPLLVQIGQGVIHESMSSFVSSYCSDYI
jgi:hypothetical protein